MDNTLSGNFSNLDDKIEIARDLIREQNFVQARKFLEELIKLSGRNPDINYLLGQIYELDQDYRKAVECFSILLELSPSNELKHRIAQCFLDGSEYRKAYDIFKELYENNYEDINIYEQYAHTARILEKTDEAVIAYNRILEVDKNNIVALTQLSELYYDSDDKINHYLVKAKLNYIESMFSSSAECLKKALNYSHDDEEIVNILLNLAKVLTDAGKYSDALEQYQFVLNLEPNNAYALEKIDALYKKMHHDEEAEVSWLEKFFSYFN
jgi:tetratricopeptide (TPR) repeat protein